MQIRIETVTATPAKLKAFVEEHKLRVPAFFNEAGHIVIGVNHRTREDALKLIAWLVRL
jgi:hypothetical protein